MTFEQIQPRDLMRLPITSLDTAPWPREEMTSYWSPNNNYRVIFSHCAEVRMGLTLCLFTLVDQHNEVIENFEPLMAIMGGCIWSKDSKYLAIQVATPSPFYMIFDVTNMQFSVIKFDLPSCCEISFKSPLMFRVEFPDSQIDASNNNHVVGGGVAEWPHHHFVKPDPLEFDLHQLPIFKPSDISNISDLIDSLDTFPSLHPIQNGFLSFSGKMPESTIDKLNGREMEIFHLEAFAEYGDEKSRQWLEEIKRITKGSYYSYETVRRYLGVRYREEPDSRVGILSKVPSYRFNLNRFWEMVVFLITGKS